MIEALRVLTLGIGGIATILSVILVTFAVLQRFFGGQRDKKKRE